MRLSSTAAWRFKQWSPYLGVDEATAEIVAMVVPTNDVGDGQVLPDLLEQIEDELEQVSTDGVYDHRHA